MTTTPLSHGPRAATGLGLFGRAFTRLFLRPAQVKSVSSPSPDFRLIVLQGEALKGGAWAPGDKIQMKVGGGFATRTYTPIEWDKAAGATRILAYCHGTGPGSEWAGLAESGDELHLFGPRRSLDLGNLAASVTLFGDETSFGLAAALLQSLQPGFAAHFVFEVNALAASAPTLNAIGIAPSSVIERRPDGSHLGEIADEILHLSASLATFILSGKASSIQQVGRALRDHGVKSQDVRTKAYWAPGKIGLD